MNILFVWTGVTAYMADCWRALAKSPDVRLNVLIQEKREANTGFDQRTVLDSLDVKLFYDDEPLEPEKIRALVSAFSPDVIFIVGWRSNLSRMIATDSSFSQVPKILIFDLPFAWTPRKLLAPLVLRRYLKLFNGCFVPGARAAAYARWLGFKEGQIQQGLFAVGGDAGEKCANARMRDCANEGMRVNHREGLASARPGHEYACHSQGESRVQPHHSAIPPFHYSSEVTGKGFLFVGRYAKEKRLDVLVAAYRRYRERVLLTPDMGDPWGLTCCGMGPEARFLKGVEGVHDLGFCQPEAVASLRKGHGALVLASDFDPWPLVIAEACAVGLPIICTEACGSHVELIRGNGIVCKTRDVEALAQAMLKMHRMSDQERFVMGQKGLELVRPYLCEAWSERVRECANARMLECAKRYGVR